MGLTKTALESDQTHRYFTQREIKALFEFTDPAVGMGSVFQGEGGGIGGARYQRQFSYETQFNVIVFMLLFGFFGFRVMLCLGVTLLPLIVSCRDLQNT